jgi:hypothetical protein
VGNGKIETESRNLRGFQAISLGGSGSLAVHRGDFKVEVTGDSNILPYIITELVGSELMIGVRPGVNIINSSRLHFEVSLPELSALKVSGSAKAVVDPFAGKDLRLGLSGSGSIQAELDYASGDLSVSGSGDMRLKARLSSLKARMSGSGDLSLKGSSDSLDLGLSGSGHFDGKDFPVDTATVKLSGSADGALRVASSLSARLSGSGRLAYWGNPRIDASASGSGGLRKAGD